MCPNKEAVAKCPKDSKVECVHLYLKVNKLSYMLSTYDRAKWNRNIGLFSLTLLSFAMGWIVNAIGLANFGTSLFASGWT